MKSTTSLCVCVLLLAVATVTRAQQVSPTDAVTVEIKSFVFEVKSCNKLGDRITCDILVTNTDSDRWLSIRNRPWSVQLGGTRLIDNLGNEYNEPLGRLGVRNLGVDQTVLVTDIPVKATIYFENIKPETTSIKLLAIESVASTTDGNDYENFIALIKDIPLAQPRLKGGQEQQLNTSHVVTTREMTFRAESCKRLAATVVCTFSVTNESSSPQTLVIDATCSKSRPRLIDDLGAEYGPRQATIGTERIVPGAPNCYAQQPIVGKGTIKASLVYENVDSKAREIKLLQLSARLGQWDRFTVDFKDIAIEK